MMEEGAGPAPWGAATFARQIVSRIQTRQMCEGSETRELYPEKDWDRLPRSWNVLLLGPTGAGKSSLIYTLWRCLSNWRTGQDIDAFKAQMANHVQALSLGWEVAAEAEEDATVADGGEQKTTKPKRSLKGKHGTKTLNLFTVQEPSEERAGIVVQDTKGQQFFDGKEQEYATRTVEGMLREGSTVEQQNLRYWIMVGSFGLFSLSSLQNSPHAVVLVFDASLKSFSKMLDVDFKDSQWQAKFPQLACYHTVIDRAAEQGLQVFVALTHVDELVKQLSPEEAKTAERRSDDRRVDEEVQAYTEELRMKLSGCLSHGARPIAFDRIFVVENYRKGHNDPDPSIDLAAAELLEAIVDAADAYVLEKLPAKSMCTVS